MTREEYDRKTADGSLTVRDVLDHREFATPEQLAVVTAHAVTPNAEVAEGLTYAAVVADALTTYERILTDCAVDAWDTIGG